MITEIELGFSACRRNMLVTDFSGVNKVLWEPVLTGTELFLGTKSVEVRLLTQRY